MQDLNNLSGKVKDELISFEIKRLQSSVDELEETFAIIEKYLVDNINKHSPEIQKKILNDNEGFKKEIRDLRNTDCDDIEQLRIASNHARTLNIGFLARAKKLNLI